MATDEIQCAEGAPLRFRETAGRSPAVGSQTELQRFKPTDSAEDPNFPDAVDRALMSRADWTETMIVPAAEHRTEIIGEVLDQLATVWPRVADLKSHIGSFVAASEGFDGRKLRKAIIAAAASSIDTARDPNQLRPEHVLTTLQSLAQSDSAKEAA